MYTCKLCKLTNSMEHSASREVDTTLSSSSNTPLFMETKVSILCSQQSITSPYSEQEESSPPLPTPICIRSILILSSHQCLCIPRVPSGLFPSGFLTKILYAFFISSMHIYRVHFILLDLIILKIFKIPPNLGEASEKRY
jgi:hypothetical protein